MAEILTESFCERCGTRYTFESPARRSSPLGALGTVGRGLRNFVVSPDQSIDEAFAVARAENEQKATAHQLEAFHQTFNFCLSCRQYTCATCWNPVDGRCQSCAPLPEAEMLPAAEVGVDAPVVAEAMAIARAAAVPVIELPPSAGSETPEHPHDELIGLEAEPEAAAIADAGPEATAEAEPEAIAEAEPEVMAEAVDAPAEQTAQEAEPFTSLAIEDLALAEPELESAAIVDDRAELEPEAVVAEPEAIVEDDLEPQPEALVEAETQTDVEPEIELEAILEVADAPASTALPEPEPEGQLAEPEPLQAEPPAAPAARRRPTSMPSLPPGVSLDDEIAAYDLRVAALAEPSVAPAPEPERYRPAAMQQPMATAHVNAAPQPAPQPALPPVYVPGPVPELPAASPAALPAAQTTGTCESCGLSLSATARFCRRCGTPQHLG